MTGVINIYHGFVETKSPAMPERMVSRLTALLLFTLVSSFSDLNYYLSFSLAGPQYLKLSERNSGPLLPLGKRLRPCKGEGNFLSENEETNVNNAGLV
jgi:hypothetical protein